MIKDFDAVRLQLKQLAEVINAFKSENVQLRIIELVLGGAPASEKLPISTDPAQPPAVAPTQRTRKRARKNVKADTLGVKPKVTRPLAKGKLGGKSTLETLVAENFFKSAKTIGQIVEHCDTNLATKFKQSDFSGPLARLVREKSLTRKKNTDGQYEYIAP
jgi:hypothetical protein